MTLAPASLKALTSDRPMPPPAPEIRTVLPSRRKGEVGSVIFAILWLTYPHPHSLPTREGSLIEFCRTNSRLPPLGGEGSRVGWGHTRYAPYGPLYATQSISTLQSTIMWLWTQARAGGWSPK